MVVEEEEEEMRGRVDALGAQEAEYLARTEDDKDGEKEANEEGSWANV